MFKSLDSIALVVGIFMYLTISQFKQVLGSRKGLDDNTAREQVGKRGAKDCSGEEVCKWRGFDLQVCLWCKPRTSNKT